MIKPEILSMVEECNDPKRSCWDCPHKELCDEFGKLIKGESVSQTVKKGIDKIVSFLTSQEVCVCEEWKEFKSKYVDIEGETWIAKVDDIETQGWYKFLFCPFCGGKNQERRKNETEIYSIR